MSNTYEAFLLFLVNLLLQSKTVEKNGIRTKVLERHFPKSSAQYRNPISRVYLGKHIHIRDINAWSVVEKLSTCLHKLSQYLYPKTHIYEYNMLRVVSHYITLHYMSQTISDISVLQRRILIKWTVHPQKYSCGSRSMMTSSNWNIFHVTGSLCGEFTGHRWIPRTKASDAGLWSFLWTAAE